MFGNIVKISLFLSFILQGCTPILNNGGYKSVTVTSIINNAQVKVMYPGSNEVYSVPSKILVKRGLTNQVIVYANGYKPYRQEIFKVTNTPEANALGFFGILESGYYSPYRYLFSEPGSNSTVKQIK